MSRVRATALAMAIAVIVAAPARPDPAVPAVLTVLGSVSESARPAANALVVALNLNSFATSQTYTSPDGSFSLPPLPAGIYKVIAVKSGFVPAIATVMPGRKDHHVKLRLQADRGRPKSTSEEIWQIRGSLPPDVLREIDQMLAPQVASRQVPRFRGEMMSMTGMTAAKEADGPAFAQTALGMQSRIGESWQMAIHGDMQRFDDPTDRQVFGTPVAQSSAVSMELRSASDDSYRVTTARSSWRYGDAMHRDYDAADLQSHNFEWAHGDARVKVRYFAHDNLFRTTPFGSDVLEIGGDTPLLQTARNDLGVSLRVRQESLRSPAGDVLRTADVVANGRVEVLPALVLQYGMASRLGVERTEWAPQTGLQWRMTRETSFVASGSYKLVENLQQAAMPFVAWSDDGQAMPLYSYSFGIVSNHDDSNRLSAIATVSAVDAPLRLILEGTQQFWDSVYVDAGDLRRDIRLAYRHDFGDRFAVDVATSAGTATPRQRDLQKVYVSGDLQSMFTPTRTTLAVSYREIKQPQHAGAEYRSSHVNVRMAQSLYLPIDVKLLIGVELVRAENSPFLLDTLLPEETSKRYVGGLAVNF